MGKLLSTILTFFIAAIGWVFFRVEKLHDAFIYIKRLFSFHFTESHLAMFDAKFYTLFFIAAFFAFFTYFKRGQKIQDAVYFNEYTNTRHTVLAVVSGILILLAASSITSSDFNPFIYFRF